MVNKVSVFTWEEVVQVLRYFEYVKLKKGKTGGSRRKFANEAKRVLNLHKPHPGIILNRYMIDQVIEFL